MLCQKERLFILCALFLLLASFAGQRAVITNISIEGPSEHTLVIPPDYPEYTQVFSCMVTWTTEGEPDVEKEEMEADFRLSYEWSVSGCEIVGSNTEETVTVRYKEENDSDALISCTVTIRSENNFGIGTDAVQSKTVFMPEWSPWTTLQIQLGNSHIEGNTTLVASPGELMEFNIVLSRLDEEDKRVSSGVEYPLDPVSFGGSTGGGVRSIELGSPFWTATGGTFPYGNVGTSVIYQAPTDEAGQFTVHCVLDDEGVKPIYEAGSRDDSPFTAPEVTLTVPGINLLGDNAVVRLNRDDDNANGQEDRLASLPFPSDDEIRQCFSMFCYPDDLEQATFNLNVTGHNRIRIWRRDSGQVYTSVPLPSASWSSSEFYSFPSRNLYIEGIETSSAPFDICLTFELQMSEMPENFISFSQKRITVVDIWLGIDANYDGVVNLSDDRIKATSGRYVFVNDDDDNGNGQQDQNDVSCANEDDLVALKLTYTPSNFSYAILSAVSGGNCIKLWNNRNKNTEITLPAVFDAGNPIPSELFIEGVMAGDCVLRLECAEYPAVKDEILLHVVHCNLALDANRDGTIHFGQYGSKQDGDASNPCLFWVNDDHDCKDDKDGGRPAQDDYDMSDKDCDDSRIGNGLSGGNWCERDLEDFTVLGVQLSDSLLNDTNVSIELKIEGNGAATPTVNLFPYTGNEVLFKYLKDKDEATAQAQVSKLVTLTNNPAVISRQSFIAKNTIYPFLMEGCSEGDGNICIVLRYNNHDMVERKTGISLHSINWFYDIYGVSKSYPHGSSNGWDVLVDTNAVKALTAGYQPETTEMLLFVHGWNMEGWEKTRWAETAFKRLWWQGYKGVVTLFSWPTLDGYSAWNMIFQTLHYDNSEFISWNSSDALLDVINQLANSTKLTILAHSMGNIVTGEAIKKYNEMGSFGYLASQAAVPAQAYSNNAADYFAANLEFVLFNFTTPDILGHFSSTGDNLSPPYFSSTLSLQSKVVMHNLYNTQDYALYFWGHNNILKPDNSGMYRFKYSENSSSHLERYIEGVDRFELGKIWDVGNVFQTLYVYTLNISPAPQSLRERYTIFSYIEQSRSWPLGRCSMAIGTPQHLDPQIFDSEHYSHSRQFRSFSAEMWDYWNLVYKITTSDQNWQVPVIPSRMFD